MGQEQKKYHIADNGDIFKLNEDGSFTFVSNIEQITSHSENNSNSSDAKNHSANDSSAKPLFKRNRKGLITEVVNNEPKLSLDLRSWFSSNYNWLYMISLVMLIISGLLCIGYNCYGDSAVLGMLSLCFGITSIVLPWIFKTIPTVWIILIFIVLITSQITIIVFSYEWLYSSQIALAFASLLAFGIAYVKNFNIQIK